MIRGSMNLNRLFSEVNAISPHKHQGLLALNPVCWLSHYCLKEAWVLQTKRKRAFHDALGKGVLKRDKRLDDRQKRSKGVMANRSISRYEMGDTETEGSAAANTCVWEVTPDSPENCAQQAIEMQVKVWVSSLKRKPKNHSDRTSSVA